MKAAWIAAAVLGLAAVAGTQAKVDRMPEKRTMSEANPFHKLPPGTYAAEYVAANLMGGLRAVAINYLWIQFTKAEREQRWVEVNAILEMIVHLQPNFAEVWNHLTWARAYNIAAQMERDEDRKAWVKSGIDSADKAIQRNPRSDKLWFQKGYLCYHRIPQEPALVEWFRQEYKQDCWEVAAENLERAIRVARANGRRNTVPPADGMLQESYFRLAFVRMKRGEFDEAIRALRRGKELFDELMIKQGHAVSSLNAKNQQLFDDLVPRFEQERELRQEQDPRKRRQLEDRLRRDYIGIEMTYAGCLGAQERILQLQAPLLADAFTLVAAGRHDEGAKKLEATAWQECADLVESLAAQRRPAALWQAVGEFYLSVMNAMNNETRSDASRAADFYEEHIESFRYILPPDHPLMELLRKRAGVLRRP